MPTKRPAGVPAYTFRVAFCFDELTCWRVLRVPKALSFEGLHQVIQACMGWDDDHLYNFRYTSNGQRFEASRPDFFTGGSPLEDGWPYAGESQLPTWRDSRTVMLDEVFKRGRKALYTYDYGDNWQISILKERSQTPLESSAPVCLDGEGSNPPEDVGGEYGFMDLIAAWNGDSTYWDGDLEGWEIEPFDLAATNRRLNRGW